MPSAGEHGCCSDSMQVLCQGSTRPGARPPRCVVSRPAQPGARCTRGPHQDATGSGCRPVRTGADRWRDVGTAAGAHGHVIPPAVAPNLHARTGLVVGTEVVEVVKGSTLLLASGVLGSTMVREAHLLSEGHCKRRASRRKG